MADSKFETPELREYTNIPKLQKDVMSNSKPFVAKEQHRKDYIPQIYSTMYPHGLIL